jgi:hypothetical protein
LAEQVDLLATTAKKYHTMQSQQGTQELFLINHPQRDTVLGAFFRVE